MRQVSLTLLLLSLSTLCLETCSQSSSFLWGAATAAQQIEGAALEDGRRDSVWDAFPRRPNTIAHNDTPAIAADSYRLHAEDALLLRDLGVNAYRLSLSWPRLLPLGHPDHLNHAAVAHYNTVIDELLALSIEPVVTLFHWDLPLTLHEEYLGLLHTQYFEEDFAAYARLCFELFGDRVKRWVTINEPWTVSHLGYGDGIFAPGRCSLRSRCAEGNSSTEPYLAAHNLLNAHAAAVEIYRREFQGTQRGEIGIAVNHDWAEEFNRSDVWDVLAAERRREFQLGWFLDPLFTGDYPQSMRELVVERLPLFSERERERLRGSFDFIGLNHYTSKHMLYRHNNRDKCREERVSAQSLARAVEANKRLHAATDRTVESLMQSFVPSLSISPNENDDSDDNNDHHDPNKNTNNKKRNLKTGKGESERKSNKSDKKTLSPSLSPSASPTVSPSHSLTSRYPKDLNITQRERELAQLPGWSADQCSYESAYNASGRLVGPQADSAWLRVAPWGFYKLLMWIQLRYYEPLAKTAMSDKNSAEARLRARMRAAPILITENGVDAPGESKLPMRMALRDSFRVNYLEHYLAAMHKAMEEGVNVQGYFVWSLLDNFEWADGYEKRFGIHYVDYKDPHRRRYKKDSAIWYKSYVAKQRATELEREKAREEKLNKEERMREKNAGLETVTAEELLTCDAKNNPRCGWMSFLVAAMRNSIFGSSFAGFPAFQD